MSDQVTGWIPVVASVKFTANKPSDWDTLTPELKAEYMYDHGQRVGSLCRQCAEEIECDYEPYEHALENLVDQFK